MRSSFVLILLSVFTPSIAAAATEWLEASSAHFVVYAKDSERDIRKFSDQLERFHAAMRLVTNAPPLTPSPSNRVTIYIVSSQDEVRKLRGGRSANVGAFYRPGAGNSVAIVPRITTGNKNLDFSMISLLHEYAHHFMYTSSNFPMPRWYSEGAAEFFSSASFTADGGVSIGQPAYHRAADLFQGIDVKVSALLDTESTSKGRRDEYDAFYGKSWLLFHYLTFNKERRDQLQRYLQLLAQGKRSLQAGQDAFGDLDALEKELDVYLMKKQMLRFNVPAEMLEPGPVTVRQLRPDEAAILPVQIRSRLGVNKEQAKTLVTEARAVAKRFPDSPAVLTALAEAENDAGNEAEAIAAADAALTNDPSRVNAYIQKGLALYTLAADDPDHETAYAQARVPFLALNRLENDHPLPLLYNYLAFYDLQKKPTPNAMDGLRRAVELAPFDSGLRLTLAHALIGERQLVEAQKHLRIVAYNPHGGRATEAAQRVLTHMESNPDWDGENVDALLNAGTTVFRKPASDR